MNRHNVGCHRGVWHHRLHRKDGAGLDEDREAGHRAVDGNFSVAFISRSVVQIIPFTFWKKYTRQVARALDRTHQEIRAKEIFVVIPMVVNALVKSVVDCQRTLNRHARLRRLIKHRVQIGHELIAEAYIVACDLLDFLTVRPWLRVSTVDHRMTTEEGCE